MSMQTPPTLLELAGKRLLRDQASAITALEHLPAELFPPLFILAFHSRQHQESLKAMAQAWPYPVLPLGGLMQRPQVKVLKAVLDGLDILLAQEIRPRCLQTPLEKLTITHCQSLTHSDLTHLFQCPNLRQLKSLRLYCASLAEFSPEPLRALLEAVAPTLQDLGLDNCAMVDSQVEVILPVLRHCHQLISLTFSENCLSLATVGKLLHHTAGLRSLELELYPVPLECYTTQDTVNQERLALVRAELTGILRELGQPRTILLATKHCGHREYYDVTFS
uniref:PRAME nuclear receptor transcriptional regulator n=1 Tax=Pipistrellus kuhlii TaxID=59472 RepID=A0A7J7V6H5_PIPKU|nr:hypothetical protein mPipKuh1_008571 [Pipistrellus kuhlii]